MSDTFQPNTTSTPMLRQYSRIKEQYQDCILFFRLGDFYEMFGQDAVTASKILGIALTSRNKGKEDSTPLCGVPYHAVQGYLAKLIRAGHKVAICEQMEDPKFAKGIVKREVIRVVTPGTVLEDNLLTDKQNNYLVAFCSHGDEIGLAALDLSTADFTITQFKDDQHKTRLENELARLQPSEILIPKSQVAPGLIPGLGYNVKSSQTSGGQAPALRVNTQDDWTFKYDQAYSKLTQTLHVLSLEGFGADELPLAVSAAGALVDYVQRTQKGSLEHLHRLASYHLTDYMILDAATQANLELTASIRGNKSASLLGVMDHTLTHMGGRLLKDWLLHPLLDVARINARQEAVAELVEQGLIRQKLRKLMEGVHDLERLISRISLGLAHARDLVALKNTLKLLPEIKHILDELESIRKPVVQTFRSAPDSIPTPGADLKVCTTKLQEINAGCDELPEVFQLIDRSIVDEPPASLKEGGLIKPGYHAGLDELRIISRDGKGWIAGLEARERERSGISSLKVRFNKVFGYYIEVTKPNLHLVPADYERKQTIANGERFVTPQLKEYEEKVLGAEERMATLEFDLFKQICAEITGFSRQIQQTAQALAQLDVLASLAELAARANYVRPRVTDGEHLEIIEGRHPVIEQLMAGKSFVPNDTRLGSDDNRLAIITGPNMAGKSTYIRQVALVVLMAQMGGFVPAKAATIGVVDRIFTRVGASDNMARGQSTFMVEMQETANILNNATPSSLIVLDEIGRGTSTFDGLSIAWAVAEHIHNHIGAKTLFATHYHELTDLALNLPGVKNYNVAVRESGDEVIFLYQVVEGGTDRSYGIHVARLAGLPPQVISRAHEILHNLERQELDALGAPKLSHTAQPPSPAPQLRGPKASSRQLPLFVTPADEAAKEIAQLDLSRLTPLEALNKLAEMQKRVK